MSLFSTIAHDGPIPGRGLPKRMWIMVAGLILAATVGFVIVNNTAVEPLGTATATNARLTHDEFFRINTTALDALVPAAAVKSPGVVDPFIYINTTALDGLTPAASAVEPKARCTAPFKSPRTQSSTPSSQTAPAKGETGDENGGTVFGCPRLVTIAEITHADEEQDVTEGIDHAPLSDRYRNPGRENQASPKHIPADNTIADSFVVG